MNKFQQTKQPIVEVEVEFLFHFIFGLFFFLVNLFYVRTYIRTFTTKNGNETNIKVRYVPYNTGWYN